MDLHDRLGLGSQSDTVRFLIGRGLDSLVGGEESVLLAVQANATAQALGRLSRILDAALINFKDPNFDPEYM